VVIRVQALYLDQDPDSEILKRIFDKIVWRGGAWPIDT